MKPKLQDQLAKITRLFEPILELEALLADVDKAEARLTDIKLQTDKAVKEQQNVNAKLQEAIDQYNQKVAWIAKTVEIKKAELEKSLSGINLQTSEVRDKFHKEQVEFDTAISTKKKELAELEGKTSTLATTIAGQEKKLDDVNEKLAALKRAL